MRKEILIIMCTFFKKCAVAFLSAALPLLLTAAFYASSLPDRYNVGQGGEFSLSTLFSVSARPTPNDLSAAHGKSTLMLFGSVPIKDVDADITERPMLVPCGEPFGVKLITNGVMVVGLQENCGKCAAKNCGIQKGDIIISISGTPVSSNEQVGDLITQSHGKPCTVIYLRDGKKMQTQLTPDPINGEYKAGMWVRDSSAGIGTMTFYEKSSGLFGGLGHPVCDADIKAPLPLSKGRTGNVRLIDFTKSRKGSPGWLSGELADSADTGSVLLNSSCGVFGELWSPPASDHTEVPLGFRQELQNGDAEIYTSTDNAGPEKYKIRISGIDLSGSKGHDFDIEVTDPELLKKTGGILQGMSGSPIIQNGRLVGAVTHVLVDDPKCGFAVFADRMYEQCEKLPHALGKAG